jgi:hypothetical protein
LSGRPAWRPYAALAAAYAAIAAAAPPWSMPFPLNDDWAYILPARRLAEHGILRLTDWASGTQVLHVAVGALWLKLFHGSFGTLKVLTLAWSALGASCLLALLLEEGVSEAAALAGALSVALNPIAVAGSLSFMTDVPYMALAIAAALAFSRAGRSTKDRLAWLAAGSALSGAAYLVRQVGLFLPLAAGLGLRARRPRELAALALPVAAAAAGHAAWFRFIHGPTWASENYVSRATLSHLSQLGRFLLDAGLRGTTVVELLGLSLSPLLLALAFGKARLLSGRDSKASNGGLAFAVLFLAGALSVAASRGPMPHLENTLYSRGLGTLTLPASSFKPAGPLAWAAFWPALTVAAAALGALLLTVLPAAVDALPSGPLLAWIGLLQIAASLVGAKFFDRYLLLALPFAAALLAGAVSRWGGSLRAGAAALALLAAFSLAGEADYAAWNRVKWKLGVAAARNGLAPSSLSGGLDWDAWWTYEDAMAKLKALKPLRSIGEWDWQKLDRKEAVLTFRPDAADGVVLVDSASYFSPLSMSEGRVYLYRWNGER